MDLLDHHVGILVVNALARLVIQGKNAQAAHLAIINLGQIVTVGYFEKKTFLVIIICFYNFRLWL